MEEYLKLVKNILVRGNYKENRTDFDTISSFAEYYKVSLNSSFPLLTTKRMDDYRWKSMIYEFLWYISGQEHIRDLRTKTKIWNNWSDESGNLETAYGRFWRRFPVPKKGLPGEVWADENCPWVNIEEDGQKTFDQVKYILDSLKEVKKNPKNMSLRRLVINAWHPGNATISKLPPCHYTFAFYVNDNKLSCHLTQRSGDVGLGIPFNLAAYSLLNNAFAQLTGFKPGHFAHTIIDAHGYCGKNERSQFYKENRKGLKSRLMYAKKPEDFLETKEWIEKNAHGENKGDHIPGLLLQCSRIPKKRPKLEIAEKPLEELIFEDFKLINYESYDPIKFDIAV